MRCIMQRMLLTLLDGTTVFVRPIAPEDKPLLVRRAARAQPGDRVPPLPLPKVRFSEAELRYLTEVDGHDHIAYVGGHRRRTLVAVGRVVRTAPDTADMAIVVGDPWQGLGLGRRLARLLADAAAAEGVTRIAGTMLADNRPALRLMQGRRHRLRARRALARRARSRHSSGCLAAFAQAAPAERRCTWSEPPSQHQRAARRRARRARRAARARARRRGLDRPRACPSRAPRRSRRRCSAAAGTSSSTAATARWPCRRARRWSSSGSPTRTCRSSPSRRTCAPASSPRSCAGCPTASRASPTSRSSPASSPASSSRPGCAAASAARTGCSAPSRRSPTISPRGSSPTRCATACSPRSATRSAGPSAPSGARTAPSCAAPRCGRRPAPAPPSPSSRARRTSGPSPPARACPAASGPSAAPVWVGELPGEALRAGLVTAAAFPIALGDECVGVIELYAGDAREPNAEVSALFATVGGQLASYLARRRVRARARRSFDGAEALVVALDADGRVEIANGTACAALGLAEDELLGRDWFASPSPSPSATRPARRSRACWPASRRAARDARRRLALVARRATPTARRSARSAGASRCRRGSWPPDRSGPDELPWSHARSRCRSSPPSSPVRLRLRRGHARRGRERQPRHARRDRRRRRRQGRREAPRAAAGLREADRQPGVRRRRRRLGRRPAPTPTDVACTQLFGGPEEATIKGTIRGNAGRRDLLAQRRLRDLALGARQAAARGGAVSYRVTVRRGPKVEHAKRESLDEALDVLEEHARAARAAPASSSSAAATSPATRSRRGSSSRARACGPASTCAATARWSPGQAGSGARRSSRGRARASLAALRRTLGVQSVSVEP